MYQHLKDKEVKCGNCVFYNDEDYEDTGFGECRRYPPCDRNDDGETVVYIHPLVYGDECWCGEWHPKQGKSDHE